MIRKATIQDVKSIHALLQEYGKKEELLARPLSELYDHIRDFSVHMDERNHQLIACCALQFCWEDLAEIRSLAVLPEHLGKNIGTKLAETVLQEAKSFNVKKVFTLTYKPDFFTKFGFIQIERSDLPLKIWADCIICVKFPDCDEIAMMKEF
jgi:amino-acid N-acetyltransferase